MNELPSYADLMRRDDAPRGSTWGVFGREDRRGTVNLIRSEDVVAAAALVREGRSFGLDYPLDAFEPPLAATRRPPVQSVFSRHLAHRDESLEIYPQASSQIDGLRHRRHAVHGFYNGLSDDDVDDRRELGVADWGDSGIVGRGVLVDLEAYAHDADHAPIHGDGIAYSLADVQGACDRVGVEPQQGDLLVFHTGWASWYLRQDTATQQRVRENKRYSGLAQDRDLIAWFWDRGAAGLFSDTYALEALPADIHSDFFDEFDHGMMHQELLALMGYPLGELWKLDGLAEHCRATGRYEFLLTAKVLNMPGGVGSPCNAIALM